MKAKAIAIEIYAGETGPIRIGPVMNLDTGLPLDLSTATAIRFRVRQYLREPNQDDDDAANPVLIEVGLPEIALEATTVEVADVEHDAFYVLVPLEVDHTVNLKGEHAYDCDATFPGGGKRFVALPGKFTVLQVVGGP